MRRSIVATCVFVGAALLSTSASAVNVCPFSPIGQLFINCPCDSTTSRAQYLKCSNKRVSAARRLGCDPGDMSRCAIFSICGLSSDFVICCDRHARATVTTGEQCLGTGGHVAVNATSICDASCSMPHHAPRPR